MVAMDSTTRQCAVWRTIFVTLALLGVFALLGCGSSSGGGGGTMTTPPRASFTGDYAGMLALGGGNELVPGDVITEANNWGAYYFTLHPDVVSVRIQIVGAGGSSSIESGGSGYEGGSGGTGTFDMTPGFLASQSAAGFWVVLGEAGRPSAGETSPISDFRAFNGGGAATDWSNAEGTYVRCGGGGGASDVRLDLPGGDMANPHAMVDACALPDTRFAVVGGGGGGTDNSMALGGAGGGFNMNGGDAFDRNGSGRYGRGGTDTIGGAINGLRCLGGDGLQDGSEGWVGGGGGGYFGGGAATAHDGGGGGSGYLMSAAGLTLVDTQSGTLGGNALTDRHGMVVITVN